MDAPATDGHSGQARVERVPRRLRDILDLDDFERAAKPKLPHAIYGYVAHGAETEATLRANRAAFDDWRLVPRVLAGVSERHQGITLLGRQYATPFGIAPMGGSALVAYEGHAVMARAARKAGIPFILSANSIIPLEEVVKANPDMWFAAYQSPDREAIEGMTRRLARAGVEVLVVTADVPIGSNREADARAGFGFPIRPSLRLGWDVATHPRWLTGVFARTLARRRSPHIDNLEPWGGPGLFSREVAGIAAHEALCWRHIRLMRELWKGKLVVKGILSSGDAAIARDCGVDGIILSNHGGRQLDQAVSPMQILPRVREQAAGLAVMIDSGFRRGTDVIKALALGADAVFVGRPFLFAAVVAGKAGVGRAIDLLRTEIDRDMALLGVRRLEELSKDLLQPTNIT
ncbi:alpha-hydroxy acid oxidase [Rhodopila sp.]|jgi:L-lactate dehydrogenase (cytochrome)|uniref:alpha-hydroxy acid oxidase n=1 Tax=Rhodopila sp. TaxID=2480087 RepID=UPI002C5872C4|nr:alpha-hydroxy acid oxidase [Rhodopila sp.]HVZ10289.1 alpha-hydroxy acid oxidase [Rhodopila sp.]